MGKDGKVTARGPTALRSQAMDMSDTEPTNGQTPEPLKLEEVLLFKVCVAAIWSDGAMGVRDACDRADNPDLRVLDLGWANLLERILREHCLR